MCRCWFFPVDQYCWQVSLKTHFSPFCYGSDTGRNFRPLQFHLYSRVVSKLPGYQLRWNLVVLAIPSPFQVSLWWRDNGALFNAWSLPVMHTEMYKPVLSLTVALWSLRTEASAQSFHLLESVRFDTNTCIRGLMESVSAYTTSWRPPIFLSSRMPCRKAANTGVLTSPKNFG